MPLYIVVNPDDSQTNGPGGPYPPHSARAGVNLNNAQAATLLGNGLTVIPDTGAGGVARAAFAILATVTPGLTTPAQRETYRLKAGLQEWQTLLRLLRTVD